MEQEAVTQEHASLENQLALLRTQMDALAAEVEEQKAKVNIEILIF